MPRFLAILVTAMLIALPSSALSNDFEIKGEMLCETKRSVYTEVRDGTPYAFDGLHLRNALDDLMVRLVYDVSYVQSQQLIFHPGEYKSYFGVEIKVETLGGRTIWHEFVSTTGERKTARVLSSRGRGVGAQFGDHANVFSITEDEIRFRNARFRRYANSKWSGIVSVNRIMNDGHPSNTLDALDCWHTEDRVDDIIRLVRNNKQEIAE